MIEIHLECLDDNITLLIFPAGQIKMNTILE